jgi:hypothetical protein
MPYSVYTKEPPMTWLVKDVPYEIPTGTEVAKRWDDRRLWVMETVTGRRLVLRSEQILVVREVTAEDIEKAKADADKAEKDGVGKIVRPQYGFPGGRH